MNAALFLFEDDVARKWLPLTETRPAGELLFGAYKFRTRIEKAFDTHCIGYVGNNELEGFDEPDAPRILNEKRPTDAALYINSRFIPEGAMHLTLGSEPAVLMCSNGACGVWDPSGKGDYASLANSAARHLEVKGRLIERIWHLISQNTQQIRDDLAFGVEGLTARTSLPEGVHLAGEAPLYADDSVAIEPHVFFDLAHGPVWLDANVTVRAFSRIQGPCYVGKNTTLLGGPYADVSIGPMCKIHGEVEESIILGYSNKAHDGFLGHAYLGHWVNLGALTTNSDLKNNYGSVRMWTPDGEADTGETKIGCLLGDHVKTGIGSMINTGTVIGTGSMIYGSEQPPKYVPPFSWGTGEKLTDYRIDKFLQTAEIAMQRRKVALSESQRRLLENVWHRSRSIS